MITKDRLTKAESNNSNLSVFVDESGDLGFTDKSSSYFVVASVIIEDNEAERTRKEIRRLLKHINTKKSKKSKISEFKYGRDSNYTKEKFFKYIINNNDLNFKAGYVVIDKNAIKNKLKDEKDKLYNLAVINSL
jgi:hypothetical protein